MKTEISGFLSPTPIALADEAKILPYFERFSTFTLTFLYLWTLLWSLSINFFILFSFGACSTVKIAVGSNERLSAGAVPDRLKTVQAYQTGLGQRRWSPHADDRGIVFSPVTPFGPSACGVSLSKCPARRTFEFLGPVDKTSSSSGFNLFKTLWNDYQYQPQNVT